MYELIRAKISIFPSKMVQETIKYAQAMSQEAPGNVSRSPGVITVDVTVALSATKYASFMVIRIILPFNQFRSPGISGNFKPFLHTFLGAPGMVQCYGGKISILPSKEVKEMDQYAQETCQECQEVQESCSGIQETYY